MWSEFLCWSLRYVSCVIACPVGGATDPAKVAYVAKELYTMGCSEISLGDTTGVGTPGVLLVLSAYAMPNPFVALSRFLDSTWRDWPKTILTAICKRLCLR